MGIPLLGLISLSVSAQDLHVPQSLPLGVFELVTGMLRYQIRLSVAKQRMPGTPFLSYGVQVERISSSPYWIQLSPLNGFHLRLNLQNLQAYVELLSYHIQKVLRTRNIHPS